MVSLANCRYLDGVERFDGDPTHSMLILLYILIFALCRQLPLSFYFSHLEGPYRRQFSIIHHCYKEKAPLKLNNL